MTEDHVPATGGVEETPAPDPIAREYLLLSLRLGKLLPGIVDSYFGPADIKAQGLVWRHRRKNGAEMDMEVIWSPLAFHGKLAALTLATDVTVRRRVT